MKRLGREASELALDRAIGGLLADRPGPYDAEHAELLATARVLRDSLPRYHPRFGFEEHLARRLAAAGRLPGAPAPQGVSGVRDEAVGGILVRLPSPPAVDPGAEPAHRRRGLLTGGAIASGVSLAIPLAGAALVAWRRGRAGGSL